VHIRVNAHDKCSEYAMLLLEQARLRSEAKMARSELEKCDGH